MALNFDASKHVGNGFLNAEHVQEGGDNVVVTVVDGEEKHFTYSDGKEEDAIVLHLAECQQDLKLNKTRTKSMINLFGSDASKWMNAKIMLTTMPTQVGDTIVIKAAPKSKQDEHDEATAEVVFGS
jgi:hypothetical protein